MKQQLHEFFTLLCFMLFALSSASAEAQQPRFLNIQAPNGLPVVPIMEGWVANPDGTRSYSYGFFNRNSETVEIPLGEKNFIEPAQFDGMQPTHFPPGRATGVFSVTVPAEKTDIDVWWNLQTDESEVLRVPGRSGRAAYELDFILPRPQGALQPFAGFGENAEIKPGLLASVTDYSDPVKAGEEILLTVRVKDPSVRDTTDRRFTQALPMVVTFNKHQGPGLVQFFRHPDNALTQVEETTKEPSTLCAGCTMSEKKTGPNVVTVPGPAGQAQVYVSFSEPGAYIVHAKVDNFSAPDSSNTNQCCWTNVFQKFTVNP